jgi:hypothetical protein
MNKETVEEAAKEYVGGIEDIVDMAGYNGFIKGAKWQKEQSASEAIEFARWLSKNCTVSRNGIQWWYTTKNSYKNVTELYELWKQTKE